MNRSSVIALAALVCCCIATTAAGANNQAQVTQIIREVNLLPSKADERRAVLNDRVTEGEAVRTGDESRSELTFPDLTITRLGANSIFSFNQAGRNVRLDSGSVLLGVPKKSGGAWIHTNAVSVAVTGTTLILESGRGGRSKLLVLEGGARLSLVKYPKQSQFARGGQMIDVPAGATTVPPPVDIDVNQVLRTHPLITGFRPLPTYPLIVATAQQQQPVYTGRPATNQPRPRAGVLPPVVGLNPRPPRGGGQPQPPPSGATGQPTDGRGKGTQTGTSPITGGSAPPANSGAPARPSIGRTVGGAAGPPTTAPSRPRKKPTPRPR